MPWGRRLQYAAVCVLVAAYAGLAHYCNSVAGAHDVGIALSLIPLCVFGSVLVWRWATPAIALALTAALAALLYGLWSLLKDNFSLYYLVQESVVYGLLSLTFGRSLFANRIPVCTRLADAVHGPLSPGEVRYTRRVTAAWALFFLAVDAISILLFLLASVRIWSIYINFCVLPSVGAMFAVEYRVRRRVLPDVKGSGLLAAIRVYLAPPQSS